MKTHFIRFALLIACATLLSGCQSIPEQPTQVLTDFNQIAHKGVIYYKTHLKSSFGRPASSQGIIPVFIGGVIIPVPTGPGLGPSTTAFYLYYIRRGNDGSLLSVAYPGEIADSTCVEVVIHKDATPKDGYQLGEAVLKPSQDCK